MPSANDPVQFTRSSAQRISAAVRWAEGEQARRQIAPRRTYALPGTEAVATEVWVGEITRTGPDEAPEPTDNSYWVRKLALPAPGEPWGEAEPDPDGPWVRAYNLDEAGGTEHAIWREIPGVVHPTSRRLALIHHFEQDGETRYVFVSYPGQRIPVLAYIPTHCDANGCPVGRWVRLNGPAYVEETTCEEPK